MTPDELRKKKFSYLVENLPKDVKERIRERIKKTIVKIDLPAMVDRSSDAVTDELREKAIQLICEKYGMEAYAVDFASTSSASDMLTGAVSALVDMTTEYLKEKERADAAEKENSRRADVQVLLSARAEKAESERRHAEKIYSETLDKLAQAESERDQLRELVKDQCKKHVGCVIVEGCPYGNDQRCDWCKRVDEVVK